MIFRTNITGKVLWKLHLDHKIGSGLPGDENDHVQVPMSCDFEDTPSRVLLALRELLPWEGKIMS